jgi:hypothetical protein
MQQNYGINFLCVASSWSTEAGSTPKIRPTPSTVVVILSSSFTGSVLRIGKGSEHETYKGKKSERRR